MTSLKPLGMSLLLHSTVKKWAAECRRVGRVGVGLESVEDCEWYGRPKEATTDENVELEHSLIMCDRRRRLYDIQSNLS